MIWLIVVVTKTSLPYRIVRGVGGEEDNKKLGKFFLQIMFPGGRKLGLHQITFVENDNEMFLLLLDDVVIKSWGEGGCDEPHIDHHQDDIADLYDSPELPPGLQV